MSTRERCTRGLVALAKAGLVVAGVPVALDRLWSLSPAPRPLWRATLVTTPAGWAHLALLAAGVLWCAAVGALVRDVGRALRSGTVTPSSWSSRWALAIAGLLVLAGATSALGSRVTARGAPAALVPARAASPTEGARAAAANLAAIAQDALGDAGGWPALASANMGRRQNDGGRFVDPSLVRSGWSFALPDGQRAPAPAAPVERHRSRRRTRRPDRPVVVPSCSLCCHGGYCPKDRTTCQPGSAARRRPAIA